MGTMAVELPSGLVTFVFTDIEGSTRLFHRHGRRYVDLLERHREILRDAWGTHRGYEVSVEGDSCLVAFSSAGDALRACQAAQRRLADEEWPDGAGVRVRMGLHAGLASPRQGAYVSLAVHQAARVMAAAHGGQILVSQQAADLLESSEGGRVLRPLGRFRLRGFDRPVPLHEVVVEGAGGQFPAVRAVPADGHNLVRRPTLTIGREEVVGALVDQVAPGHILTLVGPGGVGKTRVAAEVGMRIAPRWEAGVWMVDLSGAAEPDLVAPAIADALGAPARPGRDRWQDVLDHLENGRSVLILDNCEHLLAGCRAVVDSLLGSRPQVGILATSREPLRAPGEISWPIEPLAVPPDPDPEPAAVLGSPAGRLFAERGAAVRPGFTVDRDNAAAVAAICRRLDGLPLLIELAAAHLSARSPAEILAGLEDRFRMLRSPDPFLPGRHRTAEGLLEWSHQLLGEEERAAFRRLSVFAAGFSQSTASAAVAGGGIEAAEVPLLLWSLVDRSLVTAELGANDTRYRLLETVRSYGRRLLDERGETGAVAVTLAGALLERLGPWLPADRRWVGEVELEVDNLRGLVPLVPDEHQETAQQLACAIGRYHDAVQTLPAGIAELDRYVSTLTRPSPTRVSLLTALADLHLRSGQVPLAEDLVREAEAVRRDHGTPDWDDVGIERTRGEIARRSGDLAGAVRIARETLERPLSDRGRSRMYNLLGTTLAALGDLEGAYQACARELELNRRVGYEGYIASAHGNLAEVALRLGDPATAARHQRECLELATAQGSRAMVAFSLIVAARVAGVDGEWDTAVRLHTRAEGLLEEIGFVLYEDDLRQSEELLVDARGELGRRRFDRARRAGEGLEIPEAVGLADSVLAGAAHPG